MAKSFDRMIRIARLIQEQLSRLIHQERICQHHGLVTISHVEVARDLSQARIFIQTLDREPDAVIETLNQSSKSLRSLLGKLNHFRKMPELHFFRDLHLEHQAHLSHILSGIRER